MEFVLTLTMAPFLDKNFRGITGIYKPVGPSSHAMIYRARHWTGVKKIGHAGTLDPLAEGVLVVAVGREFTKQLGRMVKREKEYFAEIKLGETSQTDDVEGVTLKPGGHIVVPGIIRIQKLLPQFIGHIWQVPPLYSAVKIDGKEAYKYARKGENVQLQPRQREVKQIEILYYSWPILKLKIVTGAGVYIRALARDIGNQLGVGGYLQSLIRTRVAQYTLEKCYQVPNKKHYERSLYT